MLRKPADLEQKRLAWRCRRGMLELDIVLQRFVAQYAAHLNQQELGEFDALLDLPDQTFWQIIMDSNMPNAQNTSLMTKLQDACYQQGATLV